MSETCARLSLRGLRSGQFLGELLDCGIRAGPHTLFRALVLAQTQIHGLTQQSVGRTLLELDLHDRSNGEPHVAPLRIGGRRRSGGCERAEQRFERREVALREAAADPTGIRQLTLAILCEQQRTEPASAVARRRETHDDEVVGLRRVDLDPVGRALRRIWRRGTLADDAFEAHALGFGEHRLPFGFDVLGVAQRAGRRQQTAQRGLALGQRQRAQVETVEVRQIEYVQARGQLDGGTHNVGAPREAAALLQQREARQPAVVDHDDLTVEDETRERQSRHNLRDLGEHRRVVVACPRVERHDAVALFAEQPVAVVLQLEHPASR